MSDPCSPWPATHTDSRALASPWESCSFTHAACSGAARSPTGLYPGGQPGREREICSQRGAIHSNEAGEAARRRWHLSRISKGGLRFQEMDRTFRGEETTSARLGGKGLGREKEEGATPETLPQPGYGSLRARLRTGDCAGV